MQRHCFLSLAGNSVGQRVGIPGSAAMVTWVTALCGGSYPGFYGWQTERKDVCKRTKCAHIGDKWKTNMCERRSKWKEMREVRRKPANERQGRTRRETENLGTAWVNRAIWLSIIRDADDCRPVIEIPKANIDSSWSRRSSLTLTHASPPRLPSAALYPS